MTGSAPASPIGAGKTPAMAAKNCLIAPMSSKHLEGGGIATDCTEFANVKPIEKPNVEASPVASLDSREAVIAESDMAKVKESNAGVSGLPFGPQLSMCSRRSMDLAPMSSIDSTKSTVSRSSVRKLTLQAAGHEGELFEEACKLLAEVPTILKKLDPNELQNYTDLWNSPGDTLANFMPMFEGTVELESEAPSVHSTATAVDSSPAKPDRLMRLQNVLFKLKQPFVMDCKMGMRSYEESECSSKKPRKDLFERLLKIGGSGYLTAEELEQGWITKHKWMSTRDKMSSTYDLGFRIDGIAGQGTFKVKADEFSGINDRATVIALFQCFLELPFLEGAMIEKAEQMVSLPLKDDKDAQGRKRKRSSTMPLRLDNLWRRASKESLGARINLAQRIMNDILRLRDGVQKSAFFQSHEFIGSSLLFAIDCNCQSCVHLIDLAKTRGLPDGITVDHRSRWELGNHEDGFLFGVDSIVSCWQEVIDCLRIEEANQCKEEESEKASSPRSPALAMSSGDLFSIKPEADEVVQSAPKVDTDFKIASSPPKGTAKVHDSAAVELGTAKHAQNSQEPRSAAKHGLCTTLQRCMKQIIS